MKRFLAHPLALRYVVIFQLILSITLLGCSEKKVNEITVMTHDSFDLSKKIIRQFEIENKITIKFLRSGNAGSILNQAILAKNNPLADVFFGVDNTFLGRALKANIFVPYNSPMLKYIPAKFKLDPKNRLLPVDFGDICLNYDKKWFKDKNILPPTSLEDLIKPAYLGLTVVQNPATSSPGLGFLLATIAHFGEQNYLAYWRKLKVNKVLVTNSWKEAYWGHFSAASKGKRPIVVSYASSPSAEVHFSKGTLSESPTKAVTTTGSVFRQIEFIGILKGTKHLEMAKKVIDLMLSKAVQEDIPLKMFVFPTNSEARLPKVFQKHSTIAKNPVMIEADTISTKREYWIEAWNETVLQ